MGLGVAACTALGVLSWKWAPAHAMPGAFTASPHLATTLATAAWYAAATGCHLVRATHARRGLSGLAVNCCLLLLALLATALFAATYAGLSARWFWSGQVLLGVLLAQVWTTDTDMARPQSRDGNERG